MFNDQRDRTYYVVRNKFMNCLLTTCGNPLAFHSLDTAQLYVERNLITPGNFAIEKWQVTHTLLEDDVQPEGEPNDARPDHRRRQA